MPLTCTYPECDGATVCKGARETDDGEVVEKYECEYGHLMHETVTV